MVIAGYVLQVLGTADEENRCDQQGYLGLLMVCGRQWVGERKIQIRNREVGVFQEELTAVKYPLRLEKKESGTCRSEIMAVKGDVGCHISNESGWPVDPKCARAVSP